MLDPEVTGGLQQSSARGMGSGEAHLFASTFGFPAFEDDDLGQGVYTHYLMQGLSWARSEADRDADGLVTAWEAHDFARLRAQQHTGGAQVPEASIRTVGSNDMILAGDRDARAQRSDALVFHYGPLRGAWSGASLVIDGRSKGVFPAALSVPPGEHHVEVRSASGELLLDGYAQFARGESVRVSELPIRTRQDRALLSLRLGGGGGPASHWGTVWGDGWLGLEGWTCLRRARGPGKGLFVAGGFGAAVAPKRGSFVDLPRPAVWLEVEGGWGMDVRRFRFRVGWQARGTLLPVAKRPGAAHALEAEEAGWLIGSMGPSLHVGLLMSRRTSFVVAATLQGAPLDLDDGVQLHPFGAITAGVELGL